MLPLRSFIDFLESKYNRQIYGGFFEGDLYFADAIAPDFPGVESWGDSFKYPYFQKLGAK